MTTRPGTARGAKSGRGDDTAQPPSDDAQPFTATCKLKGNAGGTATLEQTDDGLTMTFAGLSVPDSGTALYSVTADDAAGEQGGQLGVKYQDGDQIANFVFDFGAGDQTNLEGEAETSADGITATVEHAHLGPLSGVGSWSAATTSTAMTWAPARARSTRCRSRDRGAASDD